MPYCRLPARPANSPIRLLRLVRIVEEKLVAVGILDHEQPVAPAAVFDGNAAGFELGAQRVERRDRSLVRLGSAFREMASELCQPCPAIVREYEGAAPAMA